MERPARLAGRRALARDEAADQKRGTPVPAGEEGRRRVGQGPVATVGADGEPFGPAGGPIMGVRPPAPEVVASALPRFRDERPRAEAERRAVTDVAAGPARLQGTVEPLVRAGPPGPEVPPDSRSRRSEPQAPR
uniref:Uncharacterized protein n=1 Tax=Streptomyces avermitilis TaxID=33903 RepID=A0A499VPV2_STRAX|nr:hypothetical protein SAVMC3_76190 [Streptomyces avermitilis]